MNLVLTITYVVTHDYHQFVQLTDCIVSILNRMVNMNKGYFKYLALCVAIFAIIVFIVHFVSAPNSTESTPQTADKEIFQDTEIPVKKQEEELAHANNEAIHQEVVHDKSREAIESTNPIQPANSGWRIIDSYDNPRVGVHVVCTPITPELIQEWLALEDADQEPKPELFETFTDNNGCFDFPFIESGRYLIRANAELWSPALGVLDLRNERPDDFSAVMVKEEVIRGKVLDCDQRPLKESDVYCYMTPTYPIEKMPLHCVGEVLLFKQHLLTDDKGEFSFRGLYPNLNYNLYTEFKDHISVNKTVSSNDKKDHIIILKKACIIEGRITGMSGEPLVDASVFYIDPQSPYVRPGIDIIDDEGYFRSDSIPEGFINIQGMHNDYGHDIIKLNIRPDRVNYAQLKLPKGVRVSITVTNDNDTPLEGIIVTVQSQDSGACITSHTTDEDGKVRICSLNKGNRNLIRTRDPHHKYTVYNRTHSFDEDEELHIRLNKRFPVKMIVMDEATKEVISDYKACVSSYYKSSALREKDSFNICTYEFEKNAPSHDFQIAKGEFFEYTVLAEGYMPERVIVMMPSDECVEIEPIELYLKPGAALNGCVVDADTSGSVPNALIQLYVNGRYDKKPGFPLTIDRTALSKEDGTFTLSGLPDHRFYLKAKAPGYAPVVIDSFELDLSAPATENRIYLKRGGSLCGKVFGQDDFPLDQAYIQLWLKGTNELLTARSKPDGNYCLYDIPPGEYVVSAWEVLDKIACDCTTKLQKTVIIVPGQTTKADFTFEGSCIIRGLCTIDGQEGNGIIINLFDEKGMKTHSVDSSSSGYYKITSLSQGSYTLEAHSTVISAGGVIRRPISLQSGQDLTVDLDFKGKAVYGTVTDAEGEPLHAAEVELLTSSLNRSFLTYTDHEGCYSIYSVEEENYFIAARAPGCGEELKGPLVLGGKGKPARKADFILKQGGTARVHVKDIQDCPLANAKILLSNNWGQGVLWTENTKYSGIAVFDHLKTETLSAIAICKDYAPASTTFIAPVGEVTDVEVSLTIGGRFKLKVKDVNGFPVSEALVSLIDFSLLGLSTVRLTQLGLLSPSNRGFLTDENGAFSFGLLPPGSYKLQITKSRRVVQASVLISSGQETVVQVVLE